MLGWRFPTRSPVAGPVALLLVAAALATGGCRRAGDPASSPNSALPVAVAPPTPAFVPDLPGPPGQWTEERILGKATVANESPAAGRALVYVPRGAQRGEQLPLLVALHGWGHSSEHWRRESRIATLADEHGVLVVCPDMGKTVYETRFYPETTCAWSRVPGALWMIDTVLPHVLGRFPVRSKAVGILGYSTGGRGAVVIAERHPGFVLCASLSGTYDLEALKAATGEYRIHAAVLGERSRFPERWRAEDCLRPETVRQLSGTVLLLAHGAKDTVVSPGQLDAAVRKLTAAGLQAEADQVDNAGHNWAFWNSELDRVFATFDDASNRRPARKEAGAR